MGGVKREIARSIKSREDMDIIVKSIAFNHMVTRIKMVTERIWSFPW